MNLRINSINFRGYDAAPLKRIYIEQEYSAPFADELKAVGMTEDIKVATIHDNLEWVQDDKSIIEKAGGPFLVSSDKASDNFLCTIRSRYKMPATRTPGYLTGGNAFIGKFPNGEKWLISGEKNKTQNKEEISKTYDIPPENIYFLPQQNYHLDMFLRPIGYPFILVNDPELVMQNIDKLDGTEEEKETFRQTTANHYKLQRIFAYYCDVNATVKKLEEIGFIPIRIAGDYGESFNFMNAIVNKHKNGTISYITNSSKCSNKLYSSIEKTFADDLREKVPYLDKIYSIEGKKSPARDTNYIMEALAYGGGGIHCMTMEEPNFKTWA